MDITKWFKGIRGRLLFSTVLPILAVGFMTWIGFSIADNLGKRLDTAYETTIPNMDALGAAMEARMSAGYRIWMVMGVDFADKEFRDKGIEGLEGHIKDFREALNKYEAAPFSPGEAELYAPFKEVKEKYFAVNEQIIKDLKLATPEGNARVMKYMRGGEWQTYGSLARKSFDTITDYYAATAAKSNLDQKAERANARLWTGVIGGGSCALLMIVLMWIAHRLASSVGQISDKISEAGAQVTAAIEQLSAAGQSLSSSSTEAAASLEETVASLEEMTSMVNLNSDNAKQAAALSTASKESAERGSNEIHILVNSMSEISQSSRKIEEIINVIDDIAFQTNLLALNAAVEAARAGEQGRGFAVVADAVRTLAQRSAEAAKDITVLIKDSVDKIERGTQVADKSGAVMSDIVTSVKKVSDLAAEISTGSGEQSTGISQISKAMNQLDASSQGNAASSEEIAATAEEISAQSTQMQKMMEDLSFLISGDRTPSATPVPAPAPLKSIPKVKPAPSKSVAKNSDDFFALDEDEETGRGKIGKASGF